jgi:protein-S-isoprenylcysteine O-methyltransferase Ste14
VSAFDPFGWAARWVPPHRLHQLIRVGAALLFCVFLARRIAEYDRFLLKPLWVVETFIYLVLLVAFLVRVEPIDRSIGVKQVLIPLIGGMLPFALLGSPPHPAVWREPSALYAVFWTMTAATALTIWGMWTLRRAFSITVEARQLVTGGPYRWIRHPIYLGEMLTAIAVAIWRFSWWNLAIVIAFVAIQLVRSREEERKLARVFQGYSMLAQRSPWFWRAAE